jgi:hypothetical protein
MLWQPKIERTTAENHRTTTKRKNSSRLAESGRGESVHLMTQTKTGFRVLMLMYTEFARAYNDAMGSASVPALIGIIYIKFALRSISQIRLKRVLHGRITPLGVVGLSRSTVIAIVIERSLVRFWERRYFLSCQAFQCHAVVSMELIFELQKVLQTWKVLEHRL